MKNILGILLLAVLVLPNVSQAYTTTKQTAVRLSDTMLMFLVTYEFGHDKFAYQMPVLAKRGSEAENVVGYDILSGGKLRTNMGDASAIVLSDASLKDGMYQVPKGESATFTLVTFLTLPKERSASSTEFALKVSSLPFKLATDNGVYLLNKLNESELVRYQTPLIDTTRSIGITTK
jgi:hypothetical protein